MHYVLFIPMRHYETICSYFKGSAGSRKAAFMMTHITKSNFICELEVTDFVSVEREESLAVNGLASHSHALMDVIDTAMETCKSILFAYSLPEAQDGAFNPAADMENRILFRVAYHYLPFGLHVCLAHTGAGLCGKVWFRNARTEPLSIQVTPD